MGGHVVDAGHRGPSPVDEDDPRNRLMNVLPAHSQREVVWAQHRTVAAMAAQIVEQGRFLGHLKFHETQDNLARGPEATSW